MPKETKKRSEHDRIVRRAGIRRGMRIAIYEIQQMLAPLGVTLAVPPDFIPYTVDIAEGGCRAATQNDLVAGICAHTRGKSCSCLSTG